MFSSFEEPPEILLNLLNSGAITIRTGAGMTGGPGAARSGSGMDGVYDGAMCSDEWCFAMASINKSGEESRR
ncbi:hypothetical protein ACOSQ3_018644 [Xanthoceras sorbifolium]